MISFDWLHGSQGFCSGGNHFSPSLTHPTPGEWYLVDQKCEDSAHLSPHLSIEQTSGLGADDIVINKKSLKLQILRVFLNSAAPGQYTALM